jgi:hypothetical protein
MTRRGIAFIVSMLGVGLLGFLPAAEETYEFDASNLRMRSCSRGRSWVFGVVLWEHCGPAADHPTGRRLRELGVVPPVNEADARWVLVKGSGAACAAGRARAASTCGH